MSLNLTRCRTCGGDITEQIHAHISHTNRQIALNRHAAMTDEERSAERRRAARKVSKTRLSKALKEAWKRRKARGAKPQDRIR